METIEEYIARLNPSMKYLRLHYRKLGIYIDTSNKRLIDNLRLAYELKGSRGLAKKMSKPTLRVGSYIYSSDIEYGLGRVTQIFKDEDSMLVLFNERSIPTMCSIKKMTTIHDETARKLEVIY